MVMFTANKKKHRYGFIYDKIKGDMERMVFSHDCVQIDVNFDINDKLSDELLKNVVGKAFIKAKYYNLQRISCYCTNVSKDQKSAKVIVSWEESRQ